MQKMSKSMRSAKLSSLKEVFEMFPDTDKAIIEDIYEQCGKSASAVVTV